KEQIPATVTSFPAVTPQGVLRITTSDKCGNCGQDIRITGQGGCNCPEDVRVTGVACNPNEDIRVIAKRQCDRRDENEDEVRVTGARPNNDDDAEVRVTMGRQRKKKQVDDKVRVTGTGPHENFKFHKGKEKVYDVFAIGKVKGRLLKGNIIELIGPDVDRTI